MCGSTIAAHSAGASAVVLERTLHTVPLGAGFFANPAHTDFQYRFMFPNRRVAGAELYLLNTRGTGPGQEVCFLLDGGSGLHTFEGATLILQAAGVLSITRDAANSVSIDRVRIVRDIQAFVDSAPSGGSIAVVVKANGNPVATLTIPSSAVQSGCFVPVGTLALAEGSKVNIDVTSVPQGANTFSGMNLSLQIRT
jgi:hypothetical protein